MNEIAFYNCRDQLGPGLLAYLEQVRDNGWRAVVRCESEEHASRMLDMLWRQYHTRFIGIGAAGTPQEADHNVLVCVDDVPANQPQCLIAIGKTHIKADEAESYRKVALMFSGDVEAEIKQARRQWKDLAASGQPLRYYDRTDGGWKQQSTANI